MPTLTPRQPVPALEVATVGGGHWRLNASPPAAFTLIVVYRGLHCPICRGYLRSLEERLDALEALGVQTIAISTDDAGRAAEAQRSWGLDRLALGYGLSIEAARAWGLYVSRAIKDAEPTEFAEPGLFLVRPDGTLYAASYATMPFARPNFDEVIAAVKFVTSNDYPARGEA